MWKQTSDGLCWEWRLRCGRFEGWPVVSLNEFGGNPAGGGLEMVPPKPLFPPCCVVVLPSATVAKVRGGSRRRDCVRNGHSPGGTLVARKVDSSPGEQCAAELGFPQASRSPGERCAEEPGYIRPVLVAGPPVYAWVVTGSLLFGSPPDVYGAAYDRLCCVNCGSTCWQYSSVLVL